MFTLSRFAAAAAAVTFAAAAHAAPPANIAGTSWSLVVDGGADETLLIDTQAGPGAPGNANCRAIRGSLASGNVAVNGWYCPATGRFHLIHPNKTSRGVMRAFMGNVSDAGVVPLQIQGTTAIDNANFGDLGEVDFTADQQP